MPLQAQGERLPKFLLLKLELVEMAKSYTLPTIVTGQNVLTAH